MHLRTHHLFNNETFLSANVLTNGNKVRVVRQWSIIIENDKRDTTKLWHMSDVTDRVPALFFSYPGVSFYILVLFFIVVLLLMFNHFLCIFFFFWFLLLIRPGHVMPVGWQVSLDRISGCADRRQSHRTRSTMFR